MNRIEIQELFYKLRDVLVWHDMSDYTRETLRDILIDLQNRIEHLESKGPDMENI